MDLKRLYIVTGKGGVGKTMTAMSLTRALQNHTDKKVLYNCFDEHSNQELCQELGIKALDLPVEISSTEYIGRKLGSKTLAKWVMKAPFFKALFNIVPSLSYMITLGHLLDKLEHDPNLILVIDAPSSGHILTVLDSPKNFDKIFKTGALVRDIKKMLDFLTDANNVESWVLSIPTELAVQEGEELSNNLSSSGIKNIKKILNNALSKASDLDREDLPEFIKQKIENEKDVLKIYDNIFSFIIPMFIDKSPTKLVKRIEEKLVAELNL